jgi:predicted O-linked N-acetylglucosamine transferase (SPINDLY family)
MLDTTGFSGFNTAMQAVEAGTPIIAMKGAFMRGRFASAILRRMELDELVAASANDYVDIASRIGRDAAYRRELRERIAGRRAILFNDEAPVRALEAFLAEAAGA